MSEEQRRTDADVIAAKEIYEVARGEADSEIAKLKEKEKAIANIFEMAGKIKATNFNKSQAAFFSLLMLKKVKDAKEYRTSMGMSWEQFCQHVGVNRRWVDEQLADLKPFKVEFLEDFLRFSEVPLSKIKYLGESIAEGNSGIEDGAITYNGETIPLDAEHKDDIQALLETLEQSHKQQTEEKDATIRTKDRLIKAKEAVITKMERELARLEKTVQKTDLTDEEQDAVNLLQEVQRDFIQWIADIKRKIKPGQAPEIALRQLYFLYIFMSKVCMEERLDLHEFYQHAEDVPWEITEMEIPSAEILIDNTPLTAGMGRAYKEKIEQRKAAKEK